VTSTTRITQNQKDNATIAFTLMTNNNLNLVMGLLQLQCVGVKYSHQKMVEHFIMVFGLRMGIDLQSVSITP
jgi:hypothetical protein